MNSPLSSFLEKENEGGKIDQIQILKTFTVLNVEQMDGLTLTTDVVSPSETFEPLPQAENLFRLSGARSVGKGQILFFKPSADEIWLPKCHLYSDATNFYATGLHELVHWSGAKTRLNRQMKGRFSSEDNAFEALIA